MPEYYLELSDTDKTLTAEDAEDAEENAMRE
jgi:hypothetical protein